MFLVEDACLVKFLCKSDEAWLESGEEQCHYRSRFRDSFVLSRVNVAGKLNEKPTSGLMPANRIRTHRCALRCTTRLFVEDPNGGYLLFTVRKRVDVDHLCSLGLWRSSHKLHH